MPIYVACHACGAENNVQDPDIFRCRKCGTMHLLGGAGG